MASSWGFSGAFGVCTAWGWGPLRHCCCPHDPRINARPAGVVFLASVGLLILTRPLWRWCWRSRWPFWPSGPCFVLRVGVIISVVILFVWDPTYCSGVVCDSIFPFLLLLVSSHSHGLRFLFCLCQGIPLLVSCTFLLVIAWSRAVFLAGSGHVLMPVPPFCPCPRSSHYIPI